MATGNAKTMKLSRGRRLSLYISKHLNLTVKVTQVTLFFINASNSEVYLDVYHMQIRGGGASDHRHHPKQ